ncbi:MAG: type I pullulanase [Ruminococcus sp.]|nr:type I pullulanase [Ruminococcus sp.]
MKLKRVITGVLSVMMMSAGMTAPNAAGKTDYVAYAAKLDKYAYSGNDLGATYTEKETTFKLWSPYADGVRVDVYEKGSEEEGGETVATKEMTLDKKTGVWEVGVNGDLAGMYYTYTVTHGDKEYVTGDIYARSCGVNGKRSMVIDLSKTNPENWDKDRHILVPHATNATVWETSVADFSSAKNSGVLDEHRGKFLAFTENGTTVDNIPGGTPTCVDYLKKLGVKYVQIMPMYDFGSVDESADIMEQYNWGYDPVNYNCPEGSYSTNPYDGNVRVMECKQMIQALHNAGIGVIMDVVYNHTYSTDSWFQYSVPNYYYRMNPDGTFSNGSGCSNDTASEHLMYRKYMIDSVTYWAKEYHIDGFRFDLMGLHDVTTMNAIRDALDGLYEDGSGKQILMYGEAWNMETNADPGTVMANQNNLKQMNERIGAFNDGIRDAVKGKVFGGGEGYVQTGKNRSGIKTGFLGQSEASTGWASAPTQCVSYASCHDNLALYDKLVDSVYGDGTYRDRHEDLVAMNKLSAAIVMTSQGVPFFLGGEEFARSKDGDENSFSSSREENMIDWKSMEKYTDIVEYYRGLMKIREAFAALSDSTPMTANNITLPDELPSGVCAYVVPNTESGKWNKLCVLFNGSNEAQNISVEGEWVQIADEETAGLRNLGTASGNLSVKAHSAAIFVDKAGYEKAGIEDHEGIVFINYYDNGSKEKLSTQAVSGEVGKAYDIADFATGLNYDVASATGDAKGTFDGTVRHADAYVIPYTGKMCEVTIRFLDAEDGSELADSYVMRSREGKAYFTPNLPSIAGYRLVLNDLPKNGAGTTSGEQITVDYKYARVSEDADSSACTVNAIYMADDGRIIETSSITGKVGEEYQIPDNEYENLNLIALPDNFIGVFYEGEINVLFRYTSRPDPYATALRYVIIALGVIGVLCIGSVFLSRHQRRERLRKRMDIIEKTE